MRLSGKERRHTSTTWRLSRSSRTTTTYVTVGLYEYVVANLPWYMKWVAQIAGYRGTTERAFKHLHLAATKSQFASVNARNILVVLCARSSMTKRWRMRSFYKPTIRVTFCFTSTWLKF